MSDADTRVTVAAHFAEGFVEAAERTMIEPGCIRYERLQGLCEPISMRRLRRRA